MQDRFKFKCWHEPTKTMYEVFDFNENFIRATPDLVVSSIRTLNAMDCVLMQCTGLKDKNGKLIYEGDIVRLFCDEFENIHTVKFGDFAMYSLDFQTEYEKGSTAVYGYYLGGLKYPIPLSISLDTSEMQIEVIGNKFKNPELLSEVE